MDGIMTDLARETPTTSSGSNSTPRAPKLRLPDLLDLTPVADSLCSVLSISEIISLTRTCKRLSTLYTNLIPSQWNVDRLLARFVDNPREFRSQMAECDAIVSGSQALQFFERVYWRESDLDVFIREGMGANTFCHYLVHTGNYDHISTKGKDDKLLYHTLDLRRIFTFTKKIGKTAEEKKIQVITTENLPVQAILRRFYTSAIINFFTWNKAYSIFPLPTFVYHKTYLFRELDEYNAPLIEKYRERGWLMQPLLSPEEKKASCPLLGERRVGDHFTWIISFNTDRVRRSQVPNEALEYCAFSIRESQDSSSPERYFVQADLFVSKALKHQYTYAGELMQFYGARTDEMTQTKLVMLPIEHRPGNSHQQLDKNGKLRHQKLLRFTRPPSRQYYDDQIPAWYQAYVEEQSAKGK